MSGKLDETLRGIDEAIDGMDIAVRGIGDTVSTARGQVAHASLISGEVIESVNQVKLKVFKLADTLDNRRVQKAIAGAMIFAILLANVARTLIPARGKKKKKRRSI